MQQPRASATLSALRPFHFCRDSSLPLQVCTLVPQAHHTSLHWYLGKVPIVLLVHTSIAAALALARAPPSLEVSARSSHLELRELITHHVLHPAPFLGCRTAGGHAAPAMLCFLSLWACPRA